MDTERNDPQSGHEGDMLFELLAAELGADAIDKLQHSISRLRSALSQSDAQQEQQTNEKDTPEGKIRVDVAVTIIRRNLSKNAVYVKIAGLPQNTFILSSRVFVLQNHNRVFHVQGALFDKQHFFFTVDEQSQVCDVFFRQRLLERTGFHRIGCHYDPIYNINLSQKMIGHWIYAKDLTSLGGCQIHFFKGIVIKVISAADKDEKLAIRDNKTFVKMIDAQNFVDSVKLTVQWPREMLSREREIFSMYNVIQFSNCLNQHVDGKGRISLNLTLVPTSLPKLKWEPLEENFRQLFSTKLSRRIASNPLELDFIVNEVVNFHTFFLHRGLVCLLVDHLMGDMLNLNASCGTCLARSGECHCDTTSLVFSGYFKLRAMSGDMAIQLLITDWDVIKELCDIKEEQLEKLSKYFERTNLLNLKGMMSTLSLSPEVQEIAAFTVKKCFGPKLIVGKYFVPFQQFKKNRMEEGDKIQIFLNGQVAEFNRRRESNSTPLEFCFKVKYVERSEKRTLKALTELTKSRLAAAMMAQLGNE